MSKGFLLDTNVPSELRRPKPDLRVTRWLQAANDDLLYLSVISIGEFLKGITVHPERDRRADLQRWLDASQTVSDLRPRRQRGQRAEPFKDFITQFFGQQHSRLE